MSTKQKIKNKLKNIEDKLKTEKGLVHQLITEHDQRHAARVEAQAKQAQADAQAKQAQADAQAKTQAEQAEADAQTKRAAEQAPLDPLAEAHKVNAALEARIAQLEKAAQDKAATDKTAAQQAKLSWLLGQDDGQESAEKMDIPTSDALPNAFADSSPASLGALLIGATDTDTVHM